MMLLLIWGLVFAVSIFVLIKAADYFTEAAEKVGTSLGISTFVVGTTIVAIGTSLPELVTAIFAVLEDASEIVIGNVVGSNITNIFLVFGIIALVGKKIKIDRGFMNVDLFFMIGSAFLLTFAVWDGVFTLPEALMCIVVVAVYLAYAVTTENNQQDEAGSQTESRKFAWKSLVVLVVSAFFIYIGAKYTVHSTIKIAEILNIGAEIIALSAIALGTSLPELVVAIVAVRKGIPYMAIGNVLGSNIFNAMAVMGIPALVGVLVIPAGIISFSLPLMMAAILMLYFVLRQEEITKWHGLLLIVLYVFFIGRLFNLV